MSITWEKISVKLKPQIPLHNHNLREQNLFTVVQASTERLRRSHVYLISKVYSLVDKHECVFTNIYINLACLSVWVSVRLFVLNKRQNG